MPEILAKLAGFFKTGAQAVATGKAQSNLGLQSPELGTAMVRVGRFLYLVSLGWISVSWYTAYVNERTTEGEPQFVLPGSKMPVISSPDRKDKTLPGMKKSASGPLGEAFGGAGEAIEGLTKLAAPGLPFGITYTTPGGKSRTLVPLSPNQLGTPGSAVAGYLWSAPNGDKQMPPYSAERYKGLVHIASQIAGRFGLRITSGYRPESSGSLHSVGLAFDMVGAMSNMKRAATWAANNPGVFQEIFIHNEGSGVHLHLGFYPDAASIIGSATRKYESARTGQAPAPAASRLSHLTVT